MMVLDVQRIFLSHLYALKPQPGQGEVCTNVGSPAYPGRAHGPPKIQTPQPGFREPFCTWVHVKAFMF